MERRPLSSRAGEPCAAAAAGSAATAAAGSVASVGGFITCSPALVSHAGSSSAAAAGGASTTAGAPSFAGSRRPAAPPQPLPSPLLILRANTAERTPACGTGHGRVGARGVPCDIRGRINASRAQPTSDECAFEVTSRGEKRPCHAHLFCPAVGGGGRHEVIGQILVLQLPEQRGLCVRDGRRCRA
eukprot:5177788-Prymnesium_polylepis.1